MGETMQARYMSEFERRINEAGFDMVTEHNFSNTGILSAMDGLRCVLRLGFGFQVGYCTLNDDPGSAGEREHLNSGWWPKLNYSDTARIAEMFDWVDAVLADDLNSAQRRAKKIDASLTITYSGDAWETFSGAARWAAEHGYCVRLTVEGEEPFDAILQGLTPEEQDGYVSGLTFKRCPEGNADNLYKSETYESGGVLVGTPVETVRVGGEHGLQAIHVY